MAKIQEPITACLKCSGPVWDNRGNKKSPKGPDFKCKDTDCAEGFWLDKPKGAVATSGGGKGRDAFVPQTVHQIAMAYQMSVAIARKAWAADKLPPQELRSAADTVFIGMQKGGTVGTFAAEKPKPADEE